MSVSQIYPKGTVGLMRSPSVCTGESLFCLQSPWAVTGPEKEALSPQNELTSHWIDTGLFPLTDPSSGRG